MEKKINRIVETSFYSLEKCEFNKVLLYVFGDNEERVGKGGQAIIRNLPNAIGIATKRSPFEYWYDNEFELNKIVIEADIQRVKTKYQEGDYDAIVFPKAGIGWGLAKLQTTAPKTALYLSQRLLEEFNFNNIGDLVNKS